MKPVRFDYVRAESISHAVEALAGAGGDGKILAGGQSLMPMMNFRLVQPSIIVDINHIDGLDRIELRAGALHLGPLVRHRMTAEHDLIARHCPVLRAAMAHVAHLTVRNRGTFCGSVCHADPAAEMPMMTLLLDGTIHTASARGARHLPARDFFHGSLVTALEPDEMVTGIEIRLPAEGTGWGFQEFARRHGDYALAAVAVLMEREDGKARNVRLAMMGVGETPLRLPDVEAVVEGRSPGPAVIAEAVEVARASLSPSSDLNASGAYRSHLAGVLAERAMAEAWSRAAEWKGGRA